MNAPITLDQLLCQYWAAKTAAEKANEQLEEIKLSIVALMPKQIEGTEAQLVGDAKVSVTYKLNRTVNNDLLQAHWAEIGPLVQQCFSWKPDVSLKDLRAAEEFAPAVYSHAAQFITTKPAKPALKIERK